jgi:hypothetical protein
MGRGRSLAGEFKLSTSIGSDHGAVRELRVARQTS